MGLKDGLNDLKVANRLFNDTAAVHHRTFYSVVLPALTKAIDCIDTVGKPQKPTDYHLREWNAYISGQTLHLSPRVVRNLSWYPEIAMDEQFWNLIRSSDRIKSSAKTMQGLVYGCHSKWNDVQQRPQFVGVRDLVRAFEGPNGVLRKWRENIDYLLAPDSTKKLAGEFYRKKMPLQQSIEELRLFEDTQFFRDVMSECARLCTRNLAAPETLDYFVDQILSWHKHEIENFRSHVNASIMSTAFDESVDVRTRLVNFAVNDADRLGDPRLRPARWVTMEESRKKVLQQLTREDIVFFFKKVMTNDRHGRADFWLRYVRSNTPVSRPLLTDTDRYRLHAELRDGSKHFGKKDGSRSAFILDFGEALIVEFNEVGKVYVFNSREKNRYLPNIFREKKFTDGELKRLEVYSKSHQGNWQYVVEQALAQSGIRP